MKLLRLHIKDEFRSLHADFEVQFHQLTDKGIKAMESFQPFCFAGLNGSGKSNVLEALGAIFYHLEFCVAKFRPRSFEKYFKRTESNPSAYTLEYLIGQDNSNPYTFKYFDKVTIEKEKDQLPKMYIQSYPFDNTIERKEVINAFIASENNEVAAEGKNYLPDLVIGYSSGENEILSLPFMKNRLINYDKYREDYLNSILYEEPETSLVYIDEGMSQAVLLSVLLFESETTLKPLREELGVVSLESFTIHLNNLRYNQDVDLMEHPILLHVDKMLDKLKKCATSWYVQEVDILGQGGKLHSVTRLDFFVNDATKTAFKQHFNTPFELFRFIQVLYELNGNIIPESLKEDVYDSKGFYTKNKLPIPAALNSVFYFQHFKISKLDQGKTEPRSSLLREFSDGEHQFLHTIGICLMLKARRSLLLLDEPETHFNPAWRAKFVKILNDSITSGSPKNSANEDFNVHLLKDVILTSHSPFIISDCMPSNVIFFKRNQDTQKVEAKNARELEFNTYGTSVEIILDELFDYDQTIGDWSNKELLDISFDSLKSKADVDQLKKRLNKLLGESIEKDLVLAKLNRLKFDD
ncbi:MAG: restriction system-associated AAA family ATPase [Bacteroidota bacterium]